MCGKKHLLLELEDSIDHAWSYFLKDNSKLKNVVMVLLKVLKTILGILARNIHCDDAGENIDFERLCKQEGMSIKFDSTMSGITQ